MSEPVLVFVNERPVRLAPGSTAADAVAGMDVRLAAGLARGAAYLTDGRGIRCDPSTPVTPGAIFRVVLTARADPGASDADP